MKRFVLRCVILLSIILPACSPNGQTQNPTAASTPIATSTTVATAQVSSLASPVSETVSDTHELSAPTPIIATPAPDFWKDLPVIPTGISDRVREIYQRGLEMGNDPNAFSKVGDCHSVNPYFLTDFDLGEGVYDLGDYASLQPTIDYFHGSFSRTSMAAKKGLSTAGVLASLWSDWKYCSSNETPLDCEFRLHRPSFAIISLGTNEAFDVKKDPSTFEGRLRRVIEHSIDQGVVPILSTKADNAEGNHYINYVTARLAMEYQLPLWNFWRAVQPLPEQGLRNPEHLTFAPTKSYTDFSKPENLNYGMQMRNLTALQMLDLMRREINESPASAAATPIVTPTAAPTIHQPGEVMKSAVDGMEMVYIPAGKFEMGSESGNADQTPIHTVQLNGFWLDRTEVTNEMFVRFLNAQGNQQEGGTTWLDPTDPFVWIVDKDGVWQTRSERDNNYPALKVSWYGAKAYCAWAGRDLPTEAQWEYAAKGMENRRFPWGNDDPVCSLARFSGCGNSPVEVGSLLSGANVWGVLNLAGNVAEWTNDRYAADYYSQSPQENPPGPINGYYRVIRGGSWQSTYLPLQTFNRKWAGADENINSVGFRCAMAP